MKGRRRAQRDADRFREAVLSYNSGDELRADFDLLRDYQMEWDRWQKEEDWEGWNPGDEHKWGSYRDDWIDDDRYSESYWDDYSTPYDALWDNHSSDLMLEYQPSTELFFAVDRAVRRHGLTATHAQAFFIATLFETSADEVCRCINLTPAGYIRR
jgi:hypothetical protein